VSSDRVLVTYCSRTGSTQSLAEVVAETLNGAGLGADVVDIATDPDPAAYRAVVIGSALRSGAWYRPASVWLIRHHDALATTPFAVFTVGMHIRDDARRALVLTYGRPLLDQYGLHPVGLEAFAGWWQPERFGWQEHLLTLGSKETTGDWRDLDAVRAWAGQIATALEPAVR
jgi:menaquinone-dependent protoporphyrinogen oxidase